MINYSSSIETTNTTCTYRLHQQQTKMQRCLGLLKTIRTMLDRRCILLPIHLFHIHLTRSLILTIIIFGEKELCEADLLLATVHLGHGAFDGAGEEVGFECLEVLIVAAAPSLDVVFEVDEEGEVSYTAVVVETE